MAIEDSQERISLGRLALSKAQAPWTDLSLSVLYFYWIIMEIKQDWKI